jgi:hypothetical protein
MKWSALAVVLTLCACGKSQADAKPAATSASATAADGPYVATQRGAGAASAARTTVAWSGSYKSTASGLYVPADWKTVHWNVKESSAGIGEGPIALAVDSTTGRVLGTIEGPLGPAAIAGLISDGKVTATIARTDPSDRGFTGTLVGLIGADHVDGTMNVSLAEADAIRTATFALSPDAAPPPPR